MSKFTKDELIRSLREDAEQTLKICQEAEESNMMTIEELEKRVSKMKFLGAYAYR
jgi:hypothetical protein